MKRRMLTKGLIHKNIPKKSKKNKGEHGSQESQGFEEI